MVERSRRTPVEDEVVEDEDEAVEHEPVAAVEVVESDEPVADEAVEDEPVAAVEVVESDEPVADEVGRRGGRAVVGRRS